MSLPMCWVVCLIRLSFYNQERMVLVDNQKIKEAIELIDS